jgi:hypothetical protein
LPAAKNCAAVSCCEFLRIGVSPPSRCGEPKARSLKAETVLRYQLFNDLAVPALGFGFILSPIYNAVVDRENAMRKSADEKKKPCKNCEGKGTLKKGDKVVRCQRCGGTGIKPS